MVLNIQILNEDFDALYHSGFDGELLIFANLDIKCNVKEKELPKKNHIN